MEKLIPIILLFFIWNLINIVAYYSVYSIRMNLLNLRKFLVVSALLVGTLHSYAQVVSDFSVDIDGWSTFGDFGGAAPGTPIYQATGGNPGGCIKQTDGTVGIWYWYGPSKFRGNLSAYYNCTLSFDLMQNHISVPVNYYDVMIFNTGTDTIVLNTLDGPSPVNTWESYAVALSTGIGWKYGQYAGAPNATSAQILAVLNDVKRIRIRAEYEGLWSETDYLDNVMLSCAVVLPVELTTFNAEEIGIGRSRLTWTTETESGCAGFQLEKSQNMFMWDSIGYVPGNGTTIEPHDYEFIDNQFNASTYYRLKEIDFEDKANYSEMVYLKSPITGPISAVIYPNPASDFLSIGVDDYDPLLGFQIIDISGQVLYTETVEEYSGAYSQQIDLRNYAAGLYSIVLNRKSGTEIHRFEVIK